MPPPPSGARCRIRTLTVLFGESFYFHGSPCSISSDGPGLDCFIQAKFRNLRGSCSISKKRTSCPCGPNQTDITLRLRSTVTPHMKAPLQNSLKSTRAALASRHSFSGSPACRASCRAASNLGSMQSLESIGTSLCRAVFTAKRPTCMRTEGRCGELRPGSVVTSGFLGSKK